MALSAKRLNTVVSPATGATTVVYTCPAGRRAIIRDIRLEAFVGAANVAVVRLGEGAAGGECEIMRLTSTAVRQLANLQDAFIVLEQLEYLEVVFGAATDGEIWVSGHEFVLP